MTSMRYGEDLPDVRARAFCRGQDCRPFSARVLACRGFAECAQQADEPVGDALVTVDLAVLAAQRAGRHQAAQAFRESRRRLTVVRARRDVRLRLQRIPGQSRVLSRPASAVAAGHWSSARESFGPVPVAATALTSDSPSAWQDTGNRGRNDT